MLLISLQFFGGRFNEAHGYGEDGDPVPRYNFDYFGPAMITCLIVITGGWYDSTVNAIGVTGRAAVMYFIVMIVTGCYVILNLFVAILLDSFALSEEGDMEGEKPKPSSRAQESSRRESSDAVRSTRLSRGSGQSQSLPHSTVRVSHMKTPSSDAHVSHLIAQHRMLRSKG